MTLEEIQAIVAAGEEADGLVTFANDNAPTIAFNFSQPSHTKVHSVVTNVKNVLKAQMEAHKSKPIATPTFDTPDVSDTWSLILPSIFGNTGADIVPDRISGSFITPETETIEIDNLSTGYKTTESKESNEIPSPPSDINENLKKNTVTTSSTTIFSSKTSSTSTTTSKRPTTTAKPIPILTRRPLRTTMKPKPTTAKPEILLATTTNSVLSAIPQNKTNNVKNFTSSKPSSDSNNIKITNNSNKIVNISTTMKPVIYEKISTYSPVSTTERPKIYYNEHNILKSNDSVIPNNATYIMTSSTSAAILNEDYEKINSTTITTQSISPSTSISPSVLNKKDEDKQDHILLDNLEVIESQTSLPLFDVAQSISQIASDLGNNFVPLPTSDTLLDVTNPNTMDIESKENVEMDIPTEPVSENKITENKTVVIDNFIKISTFDPHDEISHIEIGSSSPESVVSDLFKEEQNEQTTLDSILYSSELLTTTSTSIIDPVLTVSMDDLLSQVVHENPEPTSILLSENNTKVDTMDENETTESKIIDENVDQRTTTLNTPVPQSDIVTEITIVKNEINSANSNVGNESIDNFKNIDEDVLEPTLNSLIVIQSTTDSVLRKNESEYKKISENKSNNLNDLQEKKRVVDDKNSSTSLAPSIPPEIDITSTTPTGGLFDKKYITSSNLVNNNILQKIKLGIKPQDLPKHEDFKKKIQKVNIDDKELSNERNSSWKLIPTVPPPKINEMMKDKHKVEGFYIPESNDKDIVLEFPKENQGLGVTTKNLGEDILQFTELCNELAFKYWQMLSENIDNKRSIVFSPYSITSTLAMMFMGARGGTSGEMNEILKLDDMVTFNPHFTLKNISDSIETTSASGVAVSAFIRELFSERHKGKILTFYKERAQHFYNGHVEEINFELISDIIRRRTNLLVKRYTWGKIVEYIKSNSITMRPPLASFSANIFQVSCLF